MKTDREKVRVLVYGTERVGLKPPPSGVLSTSLFEAEFHPFDSEARFQDYDGVVLPQSVFEHVKFIPGMYQPGHWDVKYDREELVRRQNQLNQLLEKGGFACFLIHTDFVDSPGYNYSEDYTLTDLSKIVLMQSGIHKKPLGGDCPISKVKRDEFQAFLKDYGVARTEFSHYSWDSTGVGKICVVGYDNTVGFILLNKLYFVPCQLPKPNEVVDFFRKIAEALVSTSKKLLQETPDWVDEYKFPREEVLSQTKEALLKQLEDVKLQETAWKGYKRCLCYDSELLVESVSDVLTSGFGFQISSDNDEGIEDKIILDETGQELALIEITGSNGNITDFKIHQAEGHRIKRGKAANFPSLLIVNTFIKSSNNIADKTRDVEDGQAALAIKKGILLLRTIDLLNLLRLKEEGETTSKDVLDVLTNHTGWLKVSQEGYEIMSGSIPATNGL